MVRPDRAGSVAPVARSRQHPGERPAAREGVLYDKDYVAISAHGGISLPHVWVARKGSLAGP